MWVGRRARGLEGATRQVPDGQPPCRPLTAWPLILGNYTAMPLYMTAGRHRPKKRKSLAAFLHRREFIWKKHVGPMYD